MNLVSLLAERAREHPGRPALVDSCHGRDRVVTFGDLSRRVNAGAAALRDMGLARGQVVLVFQPVSIELYEFLLAAFHSGLRVMLADPSAGRDFLSLCCGRVMPDAFFGPWKAQCLRMAVPGLRRIRKPIVSGSWFPGARRWKTDGDGPPPVDLPNEEAALITFTSGSTGVPKAAARSHGFLLAQHRSLSRALDFENGEVDLITLPVFVLANLASGLTSVLAATDLARPGAPDAAAIRSQCERHGVTRCAASPAFFEGLLRSADGLPPLRKIYTGGAPVFPDLLRKLRAALPHALIHSVYGSTEAEPIAHLRADEATAEITRAGGGLCAGVPVDEIGLRIIRNHWGKPLGPMSDNEFPHMFMPAGEAGEIVVSGDHVLRGYLGGIGDGETKIRVGESVWHRSGDAGWLDATGRVWLLGRCAEKLPMFPAGERLPVEALCYPFAIECAMRENFPDIRMAAIKWKGSRTLVIGKSCASREREAIRSMAVELGMEEIVCLASLPLDRRHNAKIDYPALRGILEKTPFSKV
jgi:acyl-CoA synthetase (AMP-forming)/AMP-acid ligase II